jgi:pimeloyl-ACP methyl ester carboxylesterase
VRTGRDGLERFRAVKAAGKGYVLGALSDAETHETARLVAASGIDVKQVAGSGHFFSVDAPDAFAEAIRQIFDRRTSGAS